jgi:signal transduction histidine kinase/ActR/RegA family two-component response regulator
VTLGDQQFVVASMPLALDARGQLVTLYHLRSLTAAASEFRRVLVRNFLVYGVLAVILATLAAAVVSRSVLRSFGRFVGFMGDVAQRRSYESRFDASSAPPEIRKLTAAYDQLIASLAESHAQLTEREEQLRQSQKLEAIGTLAGGVAHDFNNVLTVIHSYTELLMGTVDRGTSTYADLEQIRQAATRAALLTSQLLAFSRKQVLQPRVIDLNSIVNGIDQMLRRIIGEHIDLQTLRASDLARVRADPGQLEQVLMNLAINARDAMPRGGRLTIETSNVSIVERSPTEHGETPPGKWVMLSVRDNGVGMSRETMARIFEPFFTTKPVGRGTGLGLAMVYGIVKQSGGFIWVFSEPGRGTMFRVYLPPVADAPAAEEGGAVPVASANGSETILLVEDEALVRGLAQRALRERGYSVIAAGDGVEALEMIADDPDRDIDLLLTDVIMPQMSGKDLADAVRAGRPRIRVLFMSGHTDDAIVHHGILDDGVLFLPKPFTPGQLTRKVREVLDQPAPNRGVTA